MLEHCSITISLTIGQYSYVLYKEKPIVPLPATVIVFALAVGVAVYPSMPSFVIPLAITGYLFSAVRFLVKSFGLSPPAKIL